MLLTHTKAAIRTIRSARIRSVLTMLGIVIGVSSITLTVALAQGVKSNTISQLNMLGDTFITVQPDGTGVRSDIDRFKQLDLTSLLSPVDVTSSLTNQDATSISGVKNLDGEAPVMVFTSTVGNAGKQLPGATVIATSPDFPRVLGKQLDSGAFFSSDEVSQPFVVLGHDIAYKLFGDDAPLGAVIKVRNHDFRVLGIMNPEKNASVRVGPAFDNAVFISIPQAKQLNGDLRFQFIYATSDAPSDTKQVATDISEAVLKNHSGEHDYSVLTREEAIAVSNQETSIVTSAAVIIMSISLLVAGVGIMNIMLMLVTERTREIGIRKALGATNRQIAYQFFTEAMVLSTLGGLVGLCLSGAVIAFVNSYTDIKMSLAWWQIVLGLGVPLIIGGIFGILPAVRAASKDPIVALRNE